MPVGGYNNFGLLCMHANDDHNAAVHTAKLNLMVKQVSINRAAFAKFEAACYPLCPAHIINCPGIHNRAIVTSFVLAGVKLSHQSHILLPHYE